MRTHNTEQLERMVKALREANALARMRLELEITQAHQAKDRWEDCLRSGCTYGAIRGSLFCQTHQVFL